MLGRWIAQRLYGVVPAGLRPWLRSLVLRLEKGPVYSLSVRWIFERYHGVTVGLYTIGPCETDPEWFARGTVIGRYCSIYYTARVLPAEGPSAPFFEGGPPWDPRGKDVPGDKTSGRGVVIGHDVYIGHNAILLPSVASIGHGAVIGAGAVVQDNVPPYAVVTGNPARVVKYRFRPATIEKLLAEQWWLWSIEELTAEGVPLQQPVEEPIGPKGNKT